MMSAAPQSPGGGSATLKPRVEMGPLKQPLFVNQTQGMSSRCKFKTLEMNLREGCEESTATSSGAELILHLSGLNERTG